MSNGWFFKESAVFYYLRSMRYSTLILFLLLQFGIAQSVEGQVADVEKILFKNNNRKNLKWADKQNPDEVKILYIKDYDDEIFPNEEILKYKNIEHIYVAARPLLIHVNDSMREPLKIVIDTVRLASLSNLSYLRMEQFDFRSFPTELTIVRSLIGLALNNCLIERLPTEINRFTQLEGLFLRQNRLSSIPRLSMLKRLKVLDLCNNSIEIVPDLSENKALEEVYLANLNGLRESPYTWTWPVKLNVNMVDYQQQITALVNLLKLPRILKLHLYSSKPSDKRDIKSAIGDKTLIKKIIWQPYDCGCG